MTGKSRAKDRLRLGGCSRDLDRVISKSQRVGKKSKHALGCADRKWGEKHVATRLICV